MTNGDNLTMAPGQDPAALGMVEAPREDCMADLVGPPVREVRIRAPFVL